MTAFADTIVKQKYSMDGKESWGEIALRVASNVLGAVDARTPIIQEVANLIADLKFIPGGRYLYASGRPFHQVQNCLLMRADDSREGWADLMHKAGMALMTGAGIGVVYSDLRPEGAGIRKTGGKASGPIPLMSAVNEFGRNVMQGGSRRSAIWAGLHWNHRDIFKFIRSKDWIPEVRALKDKDFNFPASLDMTNISVILDDAFFGAYHNPDSPMHNHAQSVYWETLRHMLKTAEPGFSIDIGLNNGENLRNACTEVTSRDDSDICNLGSINMARIESIEEMKRVTELATMFLLAGTLYSDVPFPKVDQVRTKNRRLGLGLMGLHEFLLKRGKKYGPDPELTKYLETWVDISDRASDHYADQWNISRPIKKRAIAPTGTIGIAAMTTTGMEPIFCVALKRRYLKGKVWHYQYIIDPTAERIIEQYGISPDKIEDAYSLAENVERRLEFQAYLQKYVDHSISSTINLPAWGSELNNDSRVQDFGELLMRYLPEFRGVTVYPDGARGGQPLTPVSYRTAKKHIGEVFVEGEEEIESPSFIEMPTINQEHEMTDAAAAMPVDICDLSKGGSCGT